MRTYEANPLKSVVSPKVFFENSVEFWGHVSKIQAGACIFFVDSVAVRHAHSFSSVTKPAAMRLVVVRHGEVQKKPNVIGGRHLKSPLTKLGRAQSDALGRWFKTNNMQFHSVFVSNARRTVETADMIKIHTPLPG